MIKSSLIRSGFCGNSLRYILILIFILVNIFQLKSQVNNDSSRVLSLLFIGDIMGHDEQIKSAMDAVTGIYNYDDVFQYVKDGISEADVSIANFEVTLGGQPYKGYPTFSSPVALAAACRDAGIDVFVTANNHAADRGTAGILNTISRLDSLGIKHTGTFTDMASRDSLYPMMIEKNGFLLALLNYTYGTNGIKVNAPVVVNMLDKSRITTDIENASEKNPDAIILFLHWGTEYDTIPSKTQVELADYLFSLGVDIIIGSHPHVLQKMEWMKSDSVRMKDRIVVYSLGNYVSNQRTIRRDGGAMVRIDLARNADSLFIKNAGYYLTWVYAPVENDKRKFYILPCTKFENSPDFFSRPQDYSKMRLFIRNSRSLLKNQNIRINELIF
jgi:poly-gamma-glutamate capsule biosynthesis protein CapA/YwtB (metallophosphatase superfamily)